MINQNTETNSSSDISWKSVASGFLISLLAMAAFLGLGMAFGGIGIDENVSIKSASVFTGLWFLCSTVFSIFIGSFYSARLSPYLIPKIGAANGLLIASLFVIFFLVQAINTVGSIGQSAGSLVGQTVSEAGEMASQNAGSVSMVAGYVEEQFLDLDLRSSPQVVASGVASRLLNGNTKGAQDYFSYQANIGAEEAQARIAEFSAQAESLVREAKEVAATTLESTGWSLFLLILLSAIASIAGGLMGANKVIDNSQTENVGQLQARKA